MSEQPRLEQLLERYVAYRVRGEVPPEPEALCREAPQLLEGLRELIAEYEGVARDMADPKAALHLAAALVSSPSSRRLTATAPGRAPSPTSPFTSGRMLAGRYRIGRFLGRGGLGEVWSARDVKLGVDVALKSVLGERLSDPRFRELVRHEVRSAREVHSPNVCRIYDLVEAEGHELVSMELVDGQTLHQVLRERGPLVLEEASDIASQLLAGLEAVHAAGLVHRDVKPENVMLTRTGRVVVMDLGLAKPAAEAGGSTVVGTPAYMAPEQAAGSGVDGRADLYAAGIVLAELVHPEGVAEESSHQSLLEGVRREPPEVAATPWSEVVRKAVARLPEERYGTARELARALERVTLRAASSAEVSPYPGLSAFTESDAEYFFGREAEVEALWKKLQEPPRLLAVVGPSGAGKSSFLRAGVVASRPEGWAAMVVTPGATPFVALGQTVARELRRDPSLAELMVRFSEPDVAVEVMRRWRRTAEHTLLVVDQFEELFTQSPPEAQAAFAELLGRLPLEADVHLVLGMRDDFLLASHRYSDLAPILTELTALDAPSGAALRRALMQPALKCGYRFEDEGLVEEMLAEVEGRSALPLLAFAAASLWRRRDRESGQLTRDAYVAIGGVGGALARHADETLERVGTERQGMVRELFRNLVTPQGTRASRRYETLLTVFEDRESAREVLAILIDARLLTSYETPAAEGDEPEHRVEIVHESLLAAWPRLVRWQTQDADAAQMREQVRRAAKLWEEKERADELLWSGTAYRELVVWRERYPGRLTAAERAFADATQALAHRRRRRRRRAVAVLFAAVLLVAASLGLLWQRSEEARVQTERQALRAEASKLLALGRLELESDPTAALAFALASLELADEAAARRFALQALWRGPPRLRLEGGERLRSMDFSPDGQWLAASMRDGRLSLWPRDGGAPRLLGEHLQADTITFTSGSDRLFSFSADGSLRLWSIPEGLLVHEWDGVQESRLSPFHSPVHRFPFVVAEGRIGLFSGRSEERAELQIWSLGGVEPKLERSFPLESGVVDASLSKLARAEGDDQRSLRVYELDDRAVAGAAGSHPARILHLAFSPDGQHLASADEAGEIRIWSVQLGRLELERRLRVDRVDELEFDTAGTKLVAKERDTLHVWSLPGDRSEPDWSLDSENLVMDFRFADSGSMLATNSHSTTVRLWRLAGPPDADPLVLRQGARSLEGNSVTFDPDGRWLATSDYAGISLWPTSRSYPFVVVPVSDIAIGGRIAPDGTWLVVGSTGRETPIRILPMSVGGPRWTRIQRGIANLESLPDSSGVVLCGQDGKVYVHPIGPGQPTILDAFTSQAWSLAVHPDGKLIAVGGGQYVPEEGLIRLFDLETGASRVLEAEAKRWVSDLAFLPGGDLLEANPSGVRRWDLKAGSYETLREWDWNIGFLTASRDGRWMVSYGYDFEGQRGDLLRMDDLVSGRSHTIASHGPSVFTTAFDPAGTALVTGSSDGLLRVGPVTGEEPHLLLGHELLVISLAVSSDGRWIVTGSYDGSVRLWPMPDVTATPLHVLPYEELLAKLRSLTNLRAVADETSDTGYRLDVGPFPGWETVPTW